MRRYHERVISDLLSLRTKVGLKLARLHRAKVKPFADDPANLAHRYFWLSAIAYYVRVGDYEVNIEALRLDPSAVDELMQDMVLLSYVSEHFADEVASFNQIINDVLASPKRKYLRHALGLPKASTPQLYQERLQQAINTIFVHGDESEDLQEALQEWVDKHSMDDDEDDD